MSVREDGGRAVAEIVGRRDIEEAFGGSDLGDFGLTAIPQEVRVVEGAFAAAPELATAYLWVSGDFVDRAGTACGRYDRYVYRHAQTGQAEVWLEKLEVTADRRGGVGHDFRERCFTALSRAGIWRVRTNGGNQSGTYGLARQGFHFDLARLPGFGEGGVAQGDETRALSHEGDVVRILVERLIAAALEDGRISAFEAGWIRDHKPRSSGELAQFGVRHLSRRLLATTRYPQVLEI